MFPCTWEESEIAALHPECPSLAGTSQDPEVNAMRFAQAWHMRRVVQVEAVPAVCH